MKIQGTSPLQPQTRISRTGQLQAQNTVTPTPASCSTGGTASGCTTGNYADHPTPANQVSFGRGAQGGFNLDTEIARLRSTYMVGGKVPASKAEALQRDLNGLLANPAARQAMIQRYGLDSDANKNALVAVASIESGSNGDMGEVMSVVMNRAMTKNLLGDMGGHHTRNTTVLDVINEPGQFSSRQAVAGMLAGHDTPAHHLRDFGPDARAMLPSIMSGQSSFSHTVRGQSVTRDASSMYFFNQGGFAAGTDFTVGKHHYSDRNTSSTSYASATLHSMHLLNWNR